MMRKIHLGLILLIIGFGIAFYGLETATQPPIILILTPFAYGSVFYLGILLAGFGFAILFNLIIKKIERWFHSLQD